MNYTLFHEITSPLFTTAIFDNPFALVLACFLVIFLLIAIIHLMPMSGTKCPTCESRGIETWVINGKVCPKCGTHC